MLGRGVFDFSRKGPFSRDEANEVVRVLNRITLKYSQKVNELIARLEGLNPNERSKTSEIEAVIGRLIEEWNGKVRKLGGIPKGLWLVDIDNGEGYYCWKFPEAVVEHWHDYNSGYAGRVPLTERHIDDAPKTL
jgi:hypothetical protein